MQQLCCVRRAVPAARLVNGRRSCREVELLDAISHRKGGGGADGGKVPVDREENWQREWKSKTAEYSVRKKRK